MEENTSKKPSHDKKASRRPAFTLVDWIIAAFSIALLIYLLLNMPPY